MIKKVLSHRILTFFALVILLGALLLFWPKIAVPEAAHAPDFPHASLTIRRADGQSFSYQVEVATTMAQEMYGLMYRRSLPSDQGMIFIYEPPQKISMWMKNTYIPLDMLFIRQDGTIEKIITNARPLDLTPLSSEEPVHGVIEINAGEAARHGIRPGDRVLFAGFGDQP